MLLSINIIIHMSIELIDKVNHARHYTGDCTIAQADNLYDIKIMMQPSFMCNQKCWFCTEWDNNTKIWDKDDCDKVLKMLSTLPEDKKSIYFLFHGGEPTLCKHWEYFHYKLIDMWRDRELFIQTQTNLSINYNRLEKFLSDITKHKSAHHVIDIHGSYHLDKQHVDDYVKKMTLIQDYVGFGAVSFSAEIVHKTQKTLDEYQQLVQCLPPGKVFYRSTIVNDPINVFKDGNAGKGRMLPPHEFERYSELIKEDPEYYLGKDDGGLIEYKYMKRYYPELAHDYLPFGFICPPNESIHNSRWKNLYVTKTYNVMNGITHHARIHYKSTDMLRDIIPELFEHTMNTYNRQGSGSVQNVKYMKCNSGRKGMEIAHDMTIHHCHEQTPFDFPDKNPTSTVDTVNLSKFLSKDIMCMAAECICGMDWKWKEFKNLPGNVKLHRQALNKHWFDK
jgi:hypothetical protein